MRKIELLIDDVNKKSESLNVFFDILDKSAEKISLLNEKIVDKFFHKILGNKKEEKKDEKKKK